MAVVLLVYVMNHSRKGFMVHKLPKAKVHEVQPEGEGCLWP